MAKKIIHQLVDDIDGAILEPGSGETVSFSLDGVPYEIDLSAENASTFRDALSSFARAGRRVGTTRPAKGNSRASQSSTVGETATIRQWAVANGFTVADRGRIQADVVDAYRAAH